MKNIIKKISVIAMAFTLLGAGSTVAKTVSPKTDNTISASAASHEHNWKYWKRGSEVRGDYVYCYTYYKCSCGSYYASLEQTHHK